MQKIIQWAGLLLASLMCSGFLYLELSGLGFPDGHLTDLGRLRKVIWPVFVAINIILAALSAFFLTRAVGGRQTRWLPAVSIALISANCACWLTDYILSFYFENGAGEI